VVPCSPLIQPYFISVKWDSLIKNCQAKCFSYTLSKVQNLYLQEANLVLVVDTWCICRASLHTEMIIDFALVDCSSSLWNQLGAPHITVPFRRGVYGDFGSLFGAAVGWVLVIG
jgi:hypothetical protein